MSQIIPTFADAHDFFSELFKRIIKLSIIDLLRIKNKSLIKWENSFVFVSDPIKFRISELCYEFVDFDDSIYDILFEKMENLFKNCNKLRIKNFFLV